MAPKQHVYSTQNMTFKWSAMIWEKLQEWLSFIEPQSEVLRDRHTDAPNDNVFISAFQTYFSHTVTVWLWRRRKKRAFEHFVAWNQAGTSPKTVGFDSIQKVWLKLCLGPVKSECLSNVENVKKPTSSIFYIQRGFFSLFPFHLPGYRWSHWLPF